MIDRESCGGTVSMSSGSCPLTVRQLARAYRLGTLNPLTATEACLERIADLDGAVNAFVWVDTDGALAAAHERSHELAEGLQRGPLHGIAVAVKERFDVAGAPAEYGSLTRQGLVQRVVSPLVLGGPG
jgi:aspartyl-tRNA(Asn)/glutamyl-tRNA(Gln) amidotransferase subunit A